MFEIKKMGWMQVMLACAGPHSSGFFPLQEHEGSA
jgi:hypothetical protein